MWLAFCHHSASYSETVQQHRVKPPEWDIAEMLFQLPYKYFLCVVTALFLCPLPVFLWASSLNV